MVIRKLKDGVRLWVAVVTALALLVCAAPASARSLQDSLGQDIANTLSDTTTSQLAAGPFVTSTRAEPTGAFSPSFGSTASPEDDLAAALDDLAASGDLEGDAARVAAQSAIARALAILDGGGAPAVPDDRAYQGMPLLNWNLADRVKEVHNGEGQEGNVDVRAVRFGDHALLDTWLLRFDDPDRPFTITWHVTELGTSFGGQLAPATLLGDGSTQVGQHSLLKPLARAGVATEPAVSRFHPLGAPEESRLTTQTLKVRMPPARFVRAILDPNLKPGHETFAQILPADDGALDRVAMAQQALGTTKAEAISRLAPQAPESQIYAELGALLGAEGELTAAAATAAAKATELRPLVGAMRSRDSLPAGVAGDPAADVSVVLMNDEAYISRTSVRLAEDASLEVSVTNLDGFDHRFKAVELNDRDPRLGADDWGAFRWADVGETATIPGGGGTRTLTLTPSAKAFTLWLGDPDLGDQTGMALELDRGPLVETLKLGEAGSLPLHQALDSSGRIWVTMEGADEIVRLDPSGSLGASGIERFPLPRGLKDPEHPPAAGQTEALLGPSDIAVDGRGIVWATLVAGNAIARIDPAQVEHGTTKGITVLPLEACDRFCRAPPPPVVPGPLSRQPLQMRVHEDGAGNTVVWFTEMMADRIGVIRVTPEGEKISESHVTCACTMPLGIALDAEGAIWFTEGLDNRIGKLTLDTTRPYAPSTIGLEHFKIPSGVEEFTPGSPLCAGPPACAVANPSVTSLPHSIQIDPRGRVWFTEEATEKIAYLDPAHARPGTTDGMHELDGPVNDFKRKLAAADVAFDRAGNAFFSDEYGDQIAHATVAANGDIEGRTAFRPAGRNAQTDAPMVDDAGNLWFIESGIDSITRVSGVTAGAPRPARSPLLTADTSAARLTAEGLREMTAVDLRVLRGSAVVDEAADVAVTGGAFEVPLAMKAGDRVEVTPKGEHAPRRFSFRVADLRASVAGDGTLVGSATLGGAALPDRVTITSGAATGSAGIGAERGDFTWGSGLSAATGGTLSWTAGTVAARFRTVSRFGAQGDGGTTTPPTTTPPATTPATPGATAPPARPARTPAAKPPVPARSGTKPATCAAPKWLSRSGGRTTLPLLGLTTGKAKTCLGAPGRRARAGSVERWTWAGRLELRFERGRVTSFTILDAAMRSVPDRAGVGASLSAARRALGPLVRDASGGRRGLVALSRTKVADVRLRMGRNGKVSRVSVTTRSRSALDRTSRTLLERSR